MIPLEPISTSRTLRTTAALLAGGITVALCGIVPTTSAGAAAPATTVAGAAAVPADGLIGEYLFAQDSGSTIANTATGVGAVGDAAVVQGTDAQWNGDSLTFAGGAKSSSTANWVQLPDDILAGEDSATIVSEVLIDASMKSDFNFLWNIGNDANTSYYFASVRDNARTAITTSGGGGEVNASASRALDAGRWYSLASVIDGDAGTISFYIDGKLAGTTPTDLTPASITDQSLNAIGRSPWPDPFFKGEIAAFRVYDRALTSSEVDAVSDADALAHADTFADAVQAVVDAIAPVTLATENPVLPSYNSTVTWASNTSAVTVGEDGTSTRAVIPKAGEPDVTGTLTATAQVRGVVATKTVAVTLEAPPADSDSWGNPVVQTIYTADPAPLVVGDTVYLYTGHDEDNSTWYTMNDWHVYSSTDMTNWTDHGSPMDISTFAWAKSDAWAGQAIERDGRFYWYVPVVEKATNRIAIGVAVADSPTGPFTDALGHPLISDTEIDPSVFIDDDGQAYMYWGNPNLYYVKLNADMISYSGVPAQIPLTTEGYGARPGNNTARPTLFEEGPWVYKRDGLYYNVFAAECCSEFIAYSTAPTPTGPWTYRGAIMTRQGGSFTNHAGVIDFQGNSYFVYHNAALPGGSGFTRSVAIEEFTYNADGTIPTIDMTTAGVSQVGALDPFIRQEAETISWESGIEVEASTGGGHHVTHIHDGDYIKLKGVDFADGAQSLSVRVASSGSGGRIEVRLGSRAAEPIATCEVPAAPGSAQGWLDVSCPVSGATGKADVFFVFTGAGGALFEFDSWQFDAAGAPTLEIAVDVTSRCVAGKAVLVVTVTNSDAVSVTAGVTSAYGTKSLAIAADKNGSASFTTRQAMLAGGVATVDVAATGTGGASEQILAPYPATSCGPAS